MIRFTQAVYDSGVKVGYVIINFGAGHLLDLVREQEHGVHTILINQDGYYLVGFNEADEFGFMFDNPESTLFHDYPDVWKMIRQNDQRQFIFGAYDASSLVYSPSNTINQNHLLNSGQKWYLIAYASTGMSMEPIKSSLLVMVPLTAIIIFMTYLLTIYIRKEQIARETLIRSRHENERLLYAQLQKFMDLQNNIVILSDGERLNFANKTFLRFFGYESIEAFHKDYHCICDRFIEKEPFFHLGKVKENEANWIESLLNLSGRLRVVSIVDRHAIPHAFSVSINHYDEQYYIVSFSDITDTMLEKLELAKEVTTDSLTGLYNRRYFNNQIQKILETHQNNKRHTGIIFFDIDRFKNVNDRYGHEKGDDVLREVADLVRQHTRSSDKIIRWGGEEFVIVVGLEEDEALQTMAENLRCAIEKHHFEGVGSVTCSFGCKIHDNHHDIATTLKNADELLYMAKNKGRNQVRC
jgi:diguanylate cyclase (GGDEF)-like protein